MGDRYFITVQCPECGHMEEDVYFAPTCDFDEWTCECGHKLDLCKYTGITAEDASNAGEILRIIELVRRHG